MWPLPLPIWLFLPLLFVIRGAIYNRYFHPLSKIPGPFLASLTTLWIAYQGYHGRRPRLDIALHKKYGSVVRISPKEVIFSNPEYFKTVYGAGTKFTKGRFYEAPTDRSQPENWEKLDMLAERNVEKLRVQKRFAGPVYGVGNVVRHEGKIDRNVERWFKRLDGFVGRAMEIYGELELLNVDVMTEMTFAESFGAVERGGDGEHMKEMGKMWEWWGWIGYLPWLNWFDKEYMPWKKIFVPSNAHMPVFPYCVKKIMQHDQAAAEGKPIAPSLLHDLRNLSAERPDFLPNWGTRLALTDLGAGVDTTSWTLAAVIVGISSNPSIQKKIQKELAAANLSPSSPISYADAANLSYLQACIHEATRLWPNIAISLPRIGPPITVDGFPIPAGTTIGMNSSVLGRDTSIFGPETETFRPERWLEADKTKRNEMETKNLAFGGPSRRCPGMHLAWVTMSKVLASFYARYEVKVLNRLDGPPGPGGHVWREHGSFPTKWHGLEVEITRR